MSTVPRSATLHTLVSDIELMSLDYVQRYATKEAADAATGETPEEEDEDEEMSDMGSFSDEEPTGTMDM